MRKFIQILTSFLLSWSLSSAQLNSTAEEVGTANSNAISARGLDVFGLNPANLGFSDNPGINIRIAVLTLIPSLSLQLNNNAVNAKWLNSFLNAGYMDESKKNDLLASFKEDVFSLTPKIYLPLLGVQIGKYAFMIKPEMISSVDLPTELIAFPFKGLTFDDELELEGGKVVSQVVIPISFATAFELNIPQLNPWVQETYVGVGAKVLVGAAYGELNIVEGGILSSPTALNISTEVEGKLAGAGIGFALDAGLSTSINENMKANISVNNLFGFLKWNNVTDGSYIVDGSFNRSDFQEIASYNEEQTDSLTDAIIKADTTFAGETFSSKYPAYILAGFEYSNLIPNLDILASYRQYFTDELGYNIVPRISVASVYHVNSIFPLRAGVSFGGQEGFQWSTGFGVHVGFYHVDFGFSQTGGVFNNAKGFAVALESSLWF